MLLADKYMCFSYYEFVLWSGINIKNLILLIDFTEGSLAIFTRKTLKMLLSFRARLITLKNEEVIIESKLEKTKKMLFPISLGVWTQCHHV